MYAALRYNENEVLLVLVNMTGELIDNYVLNLDDGILKNGIYNVNLLLGKGEIAQLRVDDRKFSDYVPLKELPSHSTFVMQLAP